VLLVVAKLFVTYLLIYDKRNGSEGKVESNCCVLLVIVDNFVH